MALCAPWRGFAPRSLFVLSVMVIACFGLAAASAPDAEARDIVQSSGSGGGGTIDPPTPPASPTAAPTPAPPAPTPPPTSPPDDGSASPLPPPTASLPVPPPFEPVVLERIAGGYEVRVWGRSYRFQGPLPNSISSQGQELLAAPVRLLVGGTPVSWGPITVREAQDDHVLLEATGTWETVQVAAATRVEFDGMIRVDLTASGGALPSVAYELPMRADRSSLFNHHLIYDYSSQNVEKAQAVDAAGATPAGTRRFDFVPSFWLGDREVGIEWWSETNAHWHGPSALRPIELQRSAARTLLRVEPVSAALPIAEGESWSDRFALFPMPMRPPIRDWRAVRWVVGGPGSARFDTTLGTRRTWVAFGTNFRARWHGLPHSHRDAIQEDLRAQLRQRDIDYIPYGKLTVAPSLHPHTLEMFDEWTATGSWFRTMDGAELTVAEANGHTYQPGMRHTYGVCMARRDYLDWLLTQNLEAFDDEGLDGLYFDHGAITRMCTRSPLLAGRPDREQWDYFNVRDFYLRLYTEMKRRNPQSLLVIHTVGEPRALSAYVDFHWTGEHLNTIFSGGRHGSEIEADPSLYRPDYLGLPEGFLDANLLPHVGGSWVLLPQVRQAIDPAVMKPAHRALHGWALTSDVPIVLGNTDTDEAHEIMRAVDRFGSLVGAEFVPWWAEGRPVAAEAPLRASLYRSGSRALLVVLNTGGAAVTGSVTLDLPGLQLPGATRWTDLEAGSAPTPLVGQRLSLEVPARDFRLLVVE